mmetsp:Transcript_22562/g.36747  ORF Transcript_22562/g.36747 Transcript_22562/m.36747 type:complete len:261 (+) Transcript_22562:284-1066(+)
MCSGWAGVTPPRCLGSVLRRTFAEPLDQQCVQRSVRFHRRDCRVELLFQLGVAFTQTHANAATQRNIGANEHQLTTRGFDQGHKVVSIGKDGIRFAVANSGNGFFGRCKLNQRGTTFSDVARLNGCSLCGDNAIFPIRAIGCADIGRGGGREVILGKVDNFIPLGRDAHTSHDGVVVRGYEVGNDAVPIVLDPFAGQFGTGTHFVAQLTLEPVDVTGIVDEVIGRVGALGAHAHDGMAIGKRKGCRHRKSGGCKKNGFHE